MLKCENTDIEFDGKLFHVQTEDWGSENPFLVTRVYSGGKVIGTIKTNYQSWLKLEADLRLDKLRRVLFNQHFESIEKVKKGYWS